jgi:hypothetical protein
MAHFFFDNVLEGATVSSTAATFDAINLEDWRQYTFWKANALPATITKDHGSAKSCDYLLLVGGSFAGCTVKWQASTDNFAASTVTLATISGAADENIFVHLTTPASYRYWRIRIEGATAPAISIAAIGLSLEMPYGLPDGYDAIGREEEGARNTNENGYPVGIVSTHEQFKRQLSFPLTPWVFLRSYWLPAWETIKARPFAFGWDVENHPDEIDLVMCDGKFSAPHQPGELATLGLSVSGLPTTFNGSVI